MKFVITGTALSVVKNWFPHRRHWLSGRIRRSWNETQRPLKVDSEYVESIEGPELTSVMQKQNALLVDLSQRSKFPGEAIALPVTASYVVDSSSAVELNYHIDSLRARGLLLRTNSTPVISPGGWEYLDNLLRPAGGNRSEFFVAMSFKEELRSAWVKGIQPGAADAGYAAKRVDSDIHNDRIDDRIMAGIRSSFAVIVDVTTQNAGAYFEAGFAMGLGRPVVWTVRSDDVQNLHFDTRQFMHIVWKDEAELRVRLRDHLLAVFGQGRAVT
ncbi:hypothetical protein [Stenotrophomonas geniculata]|uniref:hypothetical protein n=1 Tax=Stenotrophomonas geniculata TaxID=86188 RepID=UPI0012FE3B77|nr:hypothetical protein [Stenotrophomonas geniculata]MCF3500800.1 hypothetical protein [Stenotrophomonas maltophilia]